MKSGGTQQNGKILRKAVCLAFIGADHDQRAFGAHGQCGGELGAVDAGKSGNGGGAASPLHRRGKLGGLRNIQKSRKHKFIFTGRTYESYKEKSVGLLCRDIIADFSANASGDQKEALIRVRDEVLKWNPNWLKEVILFEDEVQEISKGNVGIVKNCKYPTKDMGAEGFAGSFFSYMDILLKQNKSNKSYCLPQYDRDYDERKLGKDYKLEIVLDSGEKAYVAKFWGSDDLQSLINYLDKNESCNYKTRVQQEF